MPLVVNSNISSLNAQRQLNSSSMDLEKASERLASGQRINSAADDAAGLAISNRQTSQIRGLDQAIRNANDGVSLIQTAEGALQESTNILQRMRELAIQSSNGIYSDTDRATLDAEVQQLVQELDRISETTSFNGQNILDGTLGNVDLQVGSEANQTVTFTIAETSTDSLGLGSTTSDLSSDTVGGNSAGDITIADGDIVINGQGLSGYTSTGDNANLQTLIDDINTNVSGVTASGFNVAEATNVGTGVMTTADTLTIGLVDVNGGSTTTFTLNNLTTNSLEELATAVTDATGGLVSGSVTDDGKFALSNTTGGTLVVTTAVGATAATGFAAGPVDYYGSLALSSDDGSDITVGLGANGTAAQLSSLGFNVVDGPGVVTGSALATANQNGALVAGDVKINGTDIGAVSANAGIAAKVTAINDKADETGVTASIVAEQSFEADLTATFATQTATSAVDLAAVAGWTDNATNTFTVNGLNLTTELAAAANANGATVEDIALVFNDNSAATGVEASINSAGFLELISDGSMNLVTIGDNTLTELGAGLTAAVAASATGGLGADDGSIVINGFEVQDLDLDSVSNAIASINAATGSTGVTAAIDENGQVQFSGTSTITLKQGDENGQGTAKALGITFTSNTINTGDGDSGTEGFDTLVIDPRIKLDSANDAALRVEVTTNGAADTGLKNLNTDLNALVTGSALSSVSVATAASAQDAITSIDNALETINDTRSQLGAINNRLDFTVSNLANVSQNSSAARSRIVDADFAAESAALSRAQVLQQASQAMLAQANARPQQVLSLLQ